MSAAATMNRVTPPSSTRRLLAGLRADARAVSYAEHVDRYGGAPRTAGEELIALVGDAGLRGRGGAAFPAGLKLAAVLEGRGRPIVVANGAEGEPPSVKDKVLLAYVPHLVLDGAVLAARAVGAKEVIVAAGPVVLPHVRHALAERRAAGADRGLTLRLVAMPDRFVAGEETALIRFLNGGPALPAFTPPRPFERGVRGAPTLVQNVETLANIALIARFGAELVSRRGNARRARNGARHALRRGPQSRRVRDRARPDAAAARRRRGRPDGRLCRRSSSAASSAPGSRGAMRRPHVSRTASSPATARRSARARSSRCRRRRAASPRPRRVARYLADESAGQCGPCVHGLASVAEGLEQLMRRERHVDHGLVRRRLAAIAGRGACSHPDGAVKLVASAYDVFQTEFERHLQKHRCTGRGGSGLKIPSGAAR